MAVSIRTLDRRMVCYRFGKAFLFQHHLSRSITVGACFAERKSLSITIHAESSLIAFTRGFVELTIKIRITFLVITQNKTRNKIND